MTPSFGLRIPPCARVDELAAFVAAAEAAGFDSAWLPDSQFLWRDVWAALAVAATRTSRIRLGSCVTNFETRHVSVTAAAAATLAELAPGRVVLGVGTGDSSVKTLGLKPTTIARTRELIALARALLAGSEAEFGGRRMRLRTPPAAPVPVYLAANGPRALSLGGEVCDGVIVITGMSGDLVRRTLDCIRGGAVGVGRAPSEVDICIGTICHVTDDPREAARIVKPYVVGTAQTGGRETLRRIGIEIDPPAVVGDIYPDMSHAEDWDAASDAADEWVSDEAALRYAEAFCLVGSVDYCITRLEEAIAAGATSFYLRHPGSYTLPTELLHAFGQTVLPRWRATA